MVGVSIFSFFPTFFLPGGYERIADELEEIPIQLLPLRGLEEKHVKRFKVISVEGPWNCGRFIDACKRSILGLHGKEITHPSLIDFILFGSERSCRRRIEMIDRLCPTALAIDVPWWVKSSAIELGPDMKSGNVRRWGIQKPSGVVLDTYHFRHVKNPEKVLESYGGFPAIKMVHLKLRTRQETKLFLSSFHDPHTSLLQSFLAHDKVTKKIPVIIEAKHNALNFPPSRREGILKIADRVREVLS